MFTHLDICNKELGEVIMEKMKIIYVNCGVKNNYTKEDHRSYIYTQLLQLRKDSLKKKSGLYGIRTLDLCDTDAALYQFYTVKANWEQVVELA